MTPKTRREWVWKLRPPTIKTRDWRQWLVEQRNNTTALLKVEIKGGNYG